MGIDVFDGLYYVLYFEMYFTFADFLHTGLLT